MLVVLPKRFTAVKTAHAFRVSKVKNNFSEA